MNSVAQGFVLGWELFNSFISDTDSDTECKLAGGMKLSGAVDTTDGGVS